MSPLPCFKLVHAVQEVSEVWNGGAAMVESALDCLEQFPLALFALDDGVNVFDPFVVLVLGKLNQESSHVKDPSEDCLDFSWCPLSQQFDDGQELVPVDRFIVGHWTTEETEDKWYDCWYPFNVADAVHEGCDQVVNEYVHLAIVVWLWVDSHGCGWRKGYVVGFSLGFSNVFLERPRDNVRMPVVAEEDFVCQVGGYFGYLAEDCRVWLTAKGESKVNVCDAVFVYDNCSGTSPWVGIDAQICCINIKFANENCPIGMLVSCCNDPVEYSIKAFAIDEVCELVVVREVIGGWAVSIAEGLVLNWSRLCNASPFGID